MENDKKEFELEELDQTEAQELLESLKAAKSPEELFSLAKKLDIELTEPVAEAWFDQLHAGQELTDEQTEAVSGGYIKWTSWYADETSPGWRSSKVIAEKDLDGVVRLFSVSQYRW